jgi:hypothetical protein
MMNNLQGVALSWISYAKANKLKPNTKKYEEIHHAYVNGIHAVMQEKTPPILSIYVMSGRDIADLAAADLAAADLAAEVVRE